MRKKVKRGGAGNDKRKRRLKCLRLLYNDTCQLCGVIVNDRDYKDGPNGGRILGPTYPTIEHIVPWSKTRQYNIDELTLYCYNCNQTDGKRHDPIQNLNQELKAIEPVTNDAPKPLPIKDTVSNGFQYHSSALYFGYSYSGRKSRSKKR